MSTNNSRYRTESRASDDSTSPGTRSFMPKLGRRVGKKGTPRLSHRKSKTGCQRCRERRVKCNEVHPVCGGCQRHSVPCIYVQPKPKRFIAEEPVKKTKAHDLEAIGCVGESKARRLLELRLLNQWVTKTGLSLPGTQYKSYRTAIVYSFPDLSMRHHALLYAKFAFAALHIAKTDGAACPAIHTEYMNHHHKYLGLALHKHQRDIARLSRDNADGVCCSSSVIRNCTQAAMQDRPLEPWSPPTQWLRMMNGTGHVFRTAWPWIAEDESSVTRFIMQHGTNFSDLASLFSKEHEAVFGFLLWRDGEDLLLEPWDEEVSEAYELTVRYIGGIKLAVDRGEDASDICRRLVVFPMLAPTAFIDLVERVEPRALVVLAYYFALLARLRGTWWIGDTGRREILAMRMVLDGKWRSLLNWPLTAMEETSVLVPWEYH